MAPSALGHGVGEAGAAAFTERHALDLDPADGGRRSREPEIEARALRHTGFRRNRRIARERREGARLEDAPRQVVCARGVQADPDRVDLDHLEGVAELAARVVVGRAAHGRTGRLRPEHAAGIRAVDRDLASVGQQNVGEEALVAPHQSSFEARFDGKLDGLLDALLDGGERLRHEARPPRGASGLTSPRAEAKVRACRIDSSG